MSFGRRVANVCIDGEGNVISYRICAEGAAGMKQSDAIGNSLHVLWYIFLHQLIYVYNQQAKLNCTVVI